MEACCSFTLLTSLGFVCRGHPQFQWIIIIHIKLAIWGVYPIDTPTLVWVFCCDVFLRLLQQNAWCAAIGWALWCQKRLCLWRDGYLWADGLTGSRRVVGKACFVRAIAELWGCLHLASQDERANRWGGGFVTCQWWKNGLDLVDWLWLARNHLCLALESVSLQQRLDESAKWILHVATSTLPNTCRCLALHPFCTVWDYGWRLLGFVG